METPELNTLEDFNKFFDSEDKAGQYLEFVRWSEGTICPKCGCKKVYTMNDPRNKKCSNKNECGLKFGVASNSLIHSTKIPLLDWLRMVFLFVKSKGRFSSSNYTERKLTTAATFTVDCRLRDIFKPILKEGQSNSFIFKEAVHNIFKLYGEVDYRRVKLYLGKSVLDLNKIVDFNDKKDYSDILTTASKLLAYGIFKKWYFLRFCSPEDIVSETLLSIVDNEEEKEITGHYLVEIMKKTMHKMWYAYIKSHPNLDRWLRKYRLQWRKDGIVNLSNYYLKQLIAQENKSWEEYSSFEELIKAKRQKIKELRSKSGKMYEYEFLHTR